MERIVLKEVWDGMVYFMQHFKGRRDTIELFCADPEASYLTYKFQTEYLSDSLYNEYINLVTRLNSFFFIDELNRCIWFWDHVSSKLVVVTYPGYILAEGAVMYNGKPLESNFFSFEHISLSNITIHSKNVATLTFLKVGQAFNIDVQYDENRKLWVQ